MRVAATCVLLSLACVCGAAAAGPVRVSVAGKLTSPVAGRSWSVRLAVRPVSFGGPIRVTASGPKRLDVRASGKRGAFTARLVFPSAGRWTLAARAGTSTSRLGAVTVQPAPPQPVVFTQPTSIDLQPDGTLLLVENNPGRVLRVDPATGRFTVLVPSVFKAYAIVRAPSGSMFLSAETTLRRVETGGSLTTLTTNPMEIGPVAVAPNGDVYFSTALQIYRVPGGTGAPVHIAGTGVEGGGGDGGPALDAQFSSPHGLAIAGDGALIVSDTGSDRLRRIDLTTGVITAFAQVGGPRGIDVATDGSIYVIDSREKRVVHLTASGARIGFLGPAFTDPYDVEIADGGVAYLLEASPVARVRRIAPDGTVTTVSRQ